MAVSDPTPSTDSVQVRLQRVEANSERRRARLRESEDNLTRLDRELRLVEAQIKHSHRPGPLKKLLNSISLR